MKYEAKDVQDTETCKSEHKQQYITVDKNGRVWQECIGCYRKLLVR